jgi:hypothetical protein
MRNPRDANRFWEPRLLAMERERRTGNDEGQEKIGKMLFPLHRKLTISPSPTSNVLVLLEFRPLRSCRV